MKGEKCSKEKTLVISEFDPITEKTTIYLVFMLDTILIMTSIFCLILLMSIFKICNMFIIVVVVVPTYN